MEDKMSLPTAFEEKMKRLIGDEYSEYLKCFDEPRHYGLRVNTAKISTEDFLKIAPWPLEPVPWIHNGFYYDGENCHPARHPYYFAGLYYLQEPSAMTPADRLPILPGDRVLDVCAAPGGKATELGARLNGTGILAANDLSSSRAKGLLKNIELMGIGNVLILSEEPGKLIPYFREYFDKILIDAPCSGEGMFRKDKKMIRAWEEHGPEYFSKIQKSIITQAAEMLKPGGMMLYSTCTFSPEENEQTIEYLLETHPEFDLCEMEGYEGFSSGMPETTASRDERHPCIFASAGLKHPYRDRKECEQGQALVGPCEVSPQDVESVCIALCKYKDHSNKNKNNCRKPKSLLCRLLINMKPVRNRQTKSTKRRISRCDRQHDNAEKRDDASHRSENVFTYNTDCSCRKRCIRCLKSQVVDTHCSCCPYHSDEAFDYHHIVECHPSLFFALHCTGDNRRLCRVES